MRNKGDRTMTLVAQMGGLGALTLLLAASRLIPHPPNFTAVGAVALMGGACFSRRLVAVAVPLLAMLLSDLILGFHSDVLFVYGSFVLIAMMGMLLRGRLRLGRVVAGAVAASLVFFIITNFGVWLTGLIYPKTAAGLLACYVAAVPFFQHTLAGDLIFSIVIYGAIRAAAYRPRLAAARPLAALDR